MGQAKKRGSRNSRIAEAVQKIEEVKPKLIVCNKCKAELTEITHLNTKGMKGIEIAFGAHCHSCNSDTWAVRGDKEAVTDLLLAMEAETGSEVNLGTAKPGNAG